MPAKRVYRKPAYKPRPKAPYRRPVAKQPYKSSGSSQSYLSAPLSALGGVAGGVGAGLLTKNPYGVKAGAAAGSAAGMLLAQGIKSLTGFGDYTVRKNSFSPGAPPLIRNHKNYPSGAVLMSHHEYLGDLISSSTANTFKLQNFTVNPGLSSTFPFLSQIAQNFQEYRVIGMLFEYRSMSADALNSTNTALGSVIMASNYDASKANYASKAEMEQSQFHQSFKPSESCVHLVECHPASAVLSELYIRTGAVGSNQDIRFSDLLNFQIASTGCQGTNVNLGEIHVSYEVLLLKPILYQSLGQDIGYAKFNSNTGVTNAVPFGTGNSVPSSGNLECTISASGLVLTIPQLPFLQSYMIMASWVSSVAGGITMPTFSIAGSDALPINMFVSTTGAAVDELSFPNTGAVTCYNTQIRQAASWNGYSNTPNTVTVTAGGTFITTSLVSFQLYVIQIPSTAS